jgi:predicted transcriptional regulator YheO
MIGTTRTGDDRLNFENKDTHPLLKSFIPVARGIAETFGDFCEVVLHDFTVDISSSIIAIYNSHVTGRTIGSPVTNLGLEILRNGKEGKETLINYTNTSISQKQIKSSSMMIRDDLGNLIGCLCINIDVAFLGIAKQVIQSIMATEAIHEKDEKFSPTINDLEEQIIYDAIEKIGKPISLMSKEEREQFIANLDEKGLFLIKGAVQKVADLLSISKYTLYNYIEKNKV